MKAFIALLMMAAIATTSCKKDKAADCVAVAEKFNKAATAYANDQTKENCAAFKAAYNDYANSSCFSSLSQDQKDQIKATAEAYDCE